MVESGWPYRNISPGDAGRANNNKKSRNSGKLMACEYGDDVKKLMNSVKVVGVNVIP